MNPVKPDAARRPFRSTNRNPPDPKSVDVAIFGAGPAGLATALALRQAAPRVSVLVIRNEGSGPARTAETLPPPAEPLLKHLGAWDALVRDGHLPSFGSAAAWGGSSLQTHDYIFHPHQRGWHIDRSRFDALLVRIARDHEIPILDAVRADPITLIPQPIPPHGKGWRFAVPSADPKSQGRVIEAGWVVDATGRGAVMARKLGARRELHDRLVAAVRRFQMPRAFLESEHRSLVESFEHGWASLGWTPEGHGIVAFMTDDDLAVAARLRSEERWASWLEHTPHLRSRLRSALPLGPVTIRPAQSGRLDRVSGDRWIAVGDAASTLDPLSSMGVFKALRSGIIASFALRDHLEGIEAAWERYGTWVRREYDGYWGGRTEFYRAERRWPSAPFWRRRQGLLMFSAGTGGPPDGLPTPCSISTRNADICSYGSIL
ncbi:MAG: FAD-dependent monooxygenase [Limisphaerales bacterium]